MIPSSAIFTLLGFLTQLGAASEWGWARWSEWSSCSKTCGDGIQKQLRRCLDFRCSGPSVRYRLCREPKCEKRKTEYEEECSLKDSRNRWTAIQRIDTCLIRCHSKTSEEEFETLLSDGINCQRSDSRQGVCLAGKCEPIGCDRIIGSSALFDQCGKCGGDGRSCDRSLFRWKETGRFSLCDRSCGPHSHQVSISVCVNSLSLRTVPDRLCADHPRPRPQIRECPQLSCPAKWKSGPWGSCSASCGGGIQRRVVECIENDNQNSEKIVEEKYCWNRERPPNERNCSTIPCPEWITGDWEPCDTVCGRGIRRRRVECQVAGRRLTRLSCPSIAEPLSVRECTIPCPSEVLSSEDTHRFAEPSSPFSRWNGDGFGVEPFGSSRFATNDLFLENSARSRPHFRPGPWGDCSTNCGPGVRMRSVDCIASGPAGSPMKLTDSECENQERPQLFQPCNLRPCSTTVSNRQNETPKSGPFKWEYGDWGPCSENCLGGKQKSTLKCVDMSTENAVPWSNCRSQPRPVDMSRSCNVQPCSPNWENTEFSSCSHSCGGGIRTRKVRCVRRVAPTDQPDSALILPDAECVEPRPIEQEACALVDCPYIWRSEQWSECSTKCGPGEQRRIVVCERRDATGIVQTFVPPLQCSSLERPKTVQLCNLGQCSERTEERELPEPMAQTVSQNTVRSRLQSYEQSRPDQQKLTLSVGGEANIYAGTSIKVKCPVRNFDKQKIVWTKNERRIENTERVRVSANGALRIFGAQMLDAGIYSCFANGIRGNVTLRIKARETSDEDVDDLQSAEQVDAHLIQKVRDSLYRLGERKALDRMKEIDRPGQLNVEYSIGEWSLCSQIGCGRTNGSQVRMLRCRLRVENVLAFVEDSICESFGVIRLASVRSCRSAECPHWEASDWSECSTSRCSKPGTSVSRREVRCRFENGTIANVDLCDRHSRPKIKKECPNVNCTAEWFESPWGSCSRKCGDGGVQMRVLRCRWKGSRKAAGANCDTTRRPAAIRSCAVPDLPPCSSSSSSSRPPTLPKSTFCRDSSRFCGSSTLRLFRSCELETIREKCCRSCSRLTNLTSLPIS